MEQLIQSHWEAPAQQETDLLVLALPLDTDLDMLADAFVNFVEERADDENEVDTDPAEDMFSWSEVSPEQFDDVCLTRRKNAASGPFLQAVYTEGRMGLIPKRSDLTQVDWDTLVADLAASQEGIADPSHDWHVLHRSYATAPKAKPDLISPAVSRADRSQPIRASAAQSERLHIFQQQEDGRHAIVAMRPIIIDKPDRDAVEATFEALQERHEILHMTFSRWDDQDYICLTDQLDAPFQSVPVFRPLQSIEAIALEQVHALAEGPLGDGLLWRAQLVERRGKGAIICIFSEAIADVKTAELLRAQIIEFYEAFKAGQNPERDAPAEAIQYVDFAAKRADLHEALGWWDNLVPLEAIPEESDPAPFIAPVESFETTLKPDVVTQLSTISRQTGLTRQTLLLVAFLKTVEQLDLTASDWVVVGTYDRRPNGLDNMLGPFSLDCPIWLGDLSSRTDPSALQLRVEDTLDHGALSTLQIEAAFPSRVPSRLPYQFVWREETILTEPIAQSADVTLRATSEAEVLHLQWCIRRDHPLSLQSLTVKRVFLKHLNQTLAV